MTRRRLGAAQAPPVGCVRHAGRWASDAGARWHGLGWAEGRQPHGLVGAGRSTRWPRQSIHPCTHASQHPTGMHSLLQGARQFTKFASLPSARGQALLRTSVTVRMLLSASAPAASPLPCCAPPGSSRCHQLTVTVASLRVWMISAAATRDAPRARRVAPLLAPPKAPPPTRGAAARAGAPVGGSTLRPGRVGEASGCPRGPTTALARIFACTWLRMLSFQPRVLLLRKL
jgi:hypothetical protein